MKVFWMKDNTKAHLCSKTLISIKESHYITGPLLWSGLIGGKFPDKRVFVQESTEEPISFGSLL